MRTALTTLILLSATAWAQSGAKLQPLNVKLGAWQVQLTSKIDNADLEAALTPDERARLASMPPEQRARMEAFMAQRSGTMHMSDYQSCLTKEQLESDGFLGRKGCTQNVITSTSSKLTLKVVCDVNGVRRSGNLDLQALDSEHVKGTGHMTWASAGRAIDTDYTFTSKWLRSSCNDLH